MIEHTLNGSYVAVIERGFWVFFPDIPGCVSAGDTIEEVVSNAQRALTIHIEASIMLGEDIPPSRGFAGIDLSEYAGAVGLFLIEIDLGAIRRWAQTTLLTHQSTCD